MKKILPLALCLLLCLAAAACKGGGSGVPNPLREVDGPEAFGELGIYIAPPAGVQNAAYSIIDGSICQIEFTLGGYEYTYRAAQANEDISGVYGQDDATRATHTINAADYDRQVDITQLSDGGLVAIWRDDPFIYTLFTPGDVAVNDFLGAVASAIDEGPKG